MFPGTPPGQPPTDQAQAYLNLTSAQITQLQSLQQQRMTAIQSTVQQISQKQQTLQQQASSGTATAAALGQLLLDIQTLHKQIDSTNSSFQAQAVKLLTADQATKLKALQAAADLAPTIQQAAGLQLLTPPANAQSGGPGGPGLSPRMRGGMEMGPGPMMRGMRPPQ
jgi:Spy/CpxP family protein refolding chaperone